MALLPSSAQLCVACFCLVLAACLAQSSVPIGCFKYDEALALTEVEVTNSCPESAVAGKLPVWGELDGTCYATMEVPNPALLQAEAVECGSGHISLFFWMDYSDAVDKFTCTVAARPFTADIWHGLETVTVVDGAAHFTINGNYPTAAKIHSKDMSAYGLYSAKISVPGVDGPVSAMYKTTHNQLEPAPAEWDELDYEILNSCGDKNCAPASGWANTFKDGTNKWEGKEWGKVMWTDPAVVDTPTLYTFSWHPNNVFWYKGTEFIYGESSDDHPLPWKPSYMVFVLWWNTAGTCEWFGGCGDKSSNATMIVQDIRQIACVDKA